MSENQFIQYDSKSGQLICHGDWNISNLSDIKNSLEDIKLPKSGKIVINGKDVTKLDSSGAWFLTKYLEKTLKKRFDIQYKDFSDQHDKLLSVSEKIKSSKKS